MQALSVGSVYGGKQGPNAGLSALRCVVMHFETHLLLDPVNLLRALPAPDSHFSKSLVNVAWPVVATRHRPAAAMVTTRSRSSMGSSLPLLWRAPATRTPSPLACRLFAEGSPSASP